MESYAAEGSENPRIFENGRSCVPRRPAEEIRAASRKLRSLGSKLRGRARERVGFAEARRRFGSRDAARGAREKLNKNASERAPACRSISGGVAGPTGLPRAAAVVEDGRRPIWCDAHRGEGRFARAPPARGRARSRGAPRPPAAGAESGDLAPASLRRGSAHRNSTAIVDSYTIRSVPLLGRSHL